MYAYCDGNPVMRVDPTGMADNTIALLLFCIFVVPAAITGFLSNFFNESMILQIFENGESYSFNELAICTDGTEGGYGDDLWHGGGTAFAYALNAAKTAWEYLNPFQVRYVVLPPEYTGNAQLGDLAMLMDFDHLKFVICIIGETRKERPNDFNEVSLSAAWDLGYTSVQANGMQGPIGNFGLIYLPGTSDIAQGVQNVAALVSIFRRFGYWMRDYATL
jgi:hypothetical protein